MNIHIKKRYVIVALACLLIIGVGFGIYNFAQSYGQTQEPIRASEIASYEDGVVQINCGKVSGSASLWNISNLGYIALTNSHVIETAANELGVKDSSINCVLNPDSEVNTGPFFGATVKAAQNKPFNKIADEAVLPIQNVSVFTKGQLVSTPLDTLNYKISSLPMCSAKMGLNTPVVVLGFPSYAIQEGSINGVQGPRFSLIASNGIISGYDATAVDVSGLPYLDYYVSAKIDSGNSGGIAFSKDAQGLCVLGIPTWVSTGNYENEGVVQNIRNIMYVP